MRKTVAALTAGALIAGGAMVATAQTDSSDPVAPDAPIVEMKRGERISSFFDDMVAQGVISQDQADTMLAELEERLRELSVRVPRPAQPPPAW